MMRMSHRVGRDPVAANGIGWRACLALAVLLAVGASRESGWAQAPDAKPAADPPGMVRMTAEQQKTVGLKTALVSAREITEPLRVTGTVAFDQGHVAVLRPLAQARVVRLLVQPGDNVRAGQVLAELYMPSLAEAQTSLIASRASLHEAQAGVAVARDALRRGEILARDGSLARAEAERRRLVLAQADASAEAARARLTALQAEIQHLGAGTAPGVARLASPIAGVVTSVAVTPGEMLDTTGAAFTVADLSVVLILAQVPEASVALLAVGDPARISLPAGGRAWTGTVVSLGAVLDMQSRTLPARIQLANPDGALRAGMAAEIVLTSDRGRSGLVVPASAVQMVGDGQVAFTQAGDGRFQSHPLTLGVQRQDWAEVRDGLHPGDTVVTEGSFALKALLQQAMLGGAG